MFKEAKWKIARRCLEQCLESKDPIIYKDLALAARAIANRMMMDWLDHKGVHHCKECPSTEQLLNISGSYSCSNHAHLNAAKTLEIVS